MSSSADLLKIVEKTLSAIAKFEEQEIEARAEEAFKAAGGKLLKRWISGDARCSAEVSLSVNNAERITMRVSLPITKPMKKEDADRNSSHFLLLASHFIPGNLSISNFGRLSLTYQNTFPKDRSADAVTELGFRLTDGHRVTSALRAELSRSSQKIAVFDAQTDEIWKSQMGMPVKLSADALAIVQGGSAVKDWVIWTGEGAGAIGGGVVGSTVGFVGGGVKGGVGAVEGGVVGAGVGGLAGQKATHDTFEGVWDWKVVWCFGSDTLVQSENGAKSISSIAVGDLVNSFDVVTGNWGLTKVSEVQVHETEDCLFSIEFLDGNTVSATSGHPFLSESQGWLHTEELKKGDVIVGVNGSLVVSAVRLLPSENRKIYNLITESGSYAVGGGAVVSGLTQAEAKKRNLI